MDLTPAKSQFFRSTRQCIQDEHFSGKQMGETLTQLSTNVLAFNFI